jgi:hypothetical protein
LLHNQILALFLKSEITLLREKADAAISENAKHPRPGIKLQGWKQRAKPLGRNLGRILENLGSVAILINRTLVIKGLQMVC